LIDDISSFLKSTFVPLSDSGSNFTIDVQPSEGGTTYVPQFIGGGNCNRLRDSIKNFTLLFDFPDAYKRLNVTMWSFLEARTETCLFNFVMILRDPTNGADYDEAVHFGHHILSEMSGLTYSYDNAKLSFEGARMTDLPRP
jgi:hypothetical protein